MTTLQFTTERVLIWGKTYPELSSTYAETVCTAGVRTDGTPIRLYPVPLRYLESGYSLYDWIEAPICKSSRDNRPESFKVDAAKICKVSSIPTDKSEWAGRAEFIFKDPAWQFENVGALKAAQAENGRSLGIVTPGSIEGVHIEYKPKDSEKKHAEKMKAIQDQQSLFLDEFKELAFRPFDVKLRWRCEVRCPECTKGPHDMKVLDWGLLELSRKAEWDPTPAKMKLEDLAGSGNYDFKLFLGNLKKYRTSFLPVAMWYPKRQIQTRLL